MILTTNQRFFQDLSRPIQVISNATGSVTFSSHENFTHQGFQDGIKVSDGQRVVRFIPTTIRAKANPNRGGLNFGFMEWEYGVSDVSDLNTAAESLANAINAARDNSPTDLEVTAFASTDGSGKVVVTQHKVGASTHTKFSENGIVSGSLSGRTGASPRFLVEHFDENVRERFYDPPTIAYFSLNRFFDQEGSIFENTVEAGESRQLALVTGSASGFYAPAIADLTHSSLGHSGSFSNPKVPNTPTRVFTNRVQNVVDFDDIGTKFLVVSGVNELSPATGTGKTYMIRCLVKQTAGNTTNILSISDRDTGVFTVYLSGGKTIRARLHAGGSDNIQVLDVTGTGYLDKWVTLFIHANATQIGPSAAFSVEDGKTIQSTPRTAGLTVSSIPDKSSMYVGYGVAGEAPGLTFATTNFLDNFQIAEIAVIEGELTHQEMKWVANAHLSNRHKSGFMNPKGREVIKQIERLPAYPTVNRYADQARLGNRKVGFDDTRTLVFSPTASVVLPEMLPKEKIGGGYNQFVPFFGYKNSGSFRLNDRIIGLGAFGPTPNSFTHSPNILKPLFTDQFVNNLEEAGQEIDLLVGGIALQRPNGLPLMANATYLNATQGEPIRQGDIAGSAPGFRGPAITTNPLSDDLLRIQRNAEHAVPPRSDLSVGPEFLARETIEPFNEIKRPSDQEHLNQRIGKLLNLTSSAGSAMSIVIDMHNSRQLDVGSGFSQTTTAAYYNFQSKRWEIKSQVEDAVVTDNTQTTGASHLLTLSSEDEIEAAIEEGLNKTNITFLGQQGFSLYPSASNPVLPFRSRARPTDAAGFPFSDKFKPEDGQKLKMSDYINEPFILQAIYFEIDGKIYEMGDESIGYIMSPNLEELPFSGSVGPGVGSNIGTIGSGKYNVYFGRQSVFGGSDIKEVSVLISDGFSDNYTATGPGVARHHHTRNQMFIPSNASPPIYYNSIRGVYGSTEPSDGQRDAGFDPDVQEIYPGTMTNDGIGAAPYWRCDSLFILRERPGSYDKFESFKLITSSSVVVSYPAGTSDTRDTSFDDNKGDNMMGLPGGTIGEYNTLAPGVRVSWMSGSGELTYFRHNISGFTSSSRPTTRELVTYAQFTHYGYAKSRGPGDKGHTMAADVANPSKNSTLLKNCDVHMNGAKDFRGFQAFANSFGIYDDPNTRGMAGGFINAPADFYDPDSDKFWSPERHHDYRDYGSWTRPGDLSGLTLLEAGLGRDRNYAIDVSTAGFVTGTVELSAAPYNKSQGGHTVNKANFPRIVADNINDDSPAVSDRTFKVFAPCRQPTRSGDVAGVSFMVNAKSTNSDFRGGELYKADLFATFPSIPSNAQRAPELSSGRSYVKAVPGKQDSTQKLLKVDSMGPKGMPSILAKDSGNSGIGHHRYIDGQTVTEERIREATGFISDSYEEESPYILYPEDELIIGFAPATAGSNEGTGRIINAAAADAVYGFGFDNINSYLDTQRDSLDAALSIFRLKQGPGKIILYGTRVSDRKKVPPSLNQELTTLSAHEVIGESMTPLDDFMTGQEGEYMGSRLTRTVTGSIFSNQFDPSRFNFSDVYGANTSTLISSDSTRVVNITPTLATLTGPKYIPYATTMFNFAADITDTDAINDITPRGVAGDLNIDGTLGISGSFNRFIELVEPDSGDAIVGATHYTDTLAPVVREMWLRDSEPEKDPCEPNWTQRLLSGVPRLYIVADMRVGRSTTGVTNGKWAKCFPFESRYVGTPIVDYSKNTLETNIPRILGMSASPTDPDIVNDQHAPFEAPAGSGNNYPYTVVFRFSNAETNLANATFVGNRPYPDKPPLEGEFAHNNLMKKVLTFFYGFGDNTVGSLHTRTTAPGLNEPFQRPAQFVHPSGWKYGLSNVVPTRRKFIFRPDKFGQFRDMLEQPLDSSYGQQVRKPGAFGGGGQLGERAGGQAGAVEQWTHQPAVYCRFLDASGQQLPSNQHDLTSCNNLSEYATSSMPYFDSFDNLQKPVVSRDIVFAPAEVFVDLQVPELPSFPNLDFL